MIFGRWDYRKYSMEMVKAFHEEFGPDEPVELILSADNPYPVDKMNSTEERLKYYGFDKNENIIIKHFPSRRIYKLHSYRRLPSECIPIRGMGVTNY
jgi:hypothetical protein